MMKKILPLKPQTRFYFPKHPHLIKPTTSNPPFSVKFNLKTPANPPSSSSSPKIQTTPVINGVENDKFLEITPTGYSRYVVLGAVSVGVALFLMGVNGDEKALALGPEGPLMEEFWDNMRRYALYALTVGTGFAYTLFEPIFELLKNPVSAILILIIFGGTFYVGYQVLSAMVGVSDFSYDYGY